MHSALPLPGGTHSSISSDDTPFAFLPTNTQDSTSQYYYLPSTRSAPARGFWSAYNKRTGSTGASHNVSSSSLKSRLLLVVYTLRYNARAQWLLVCSCLVLIIFFQIFAAMAPASSSSASAAAAAAVNMYSRTGSATALLKRPGQALSTEVFHNELSKMGGAIAGEGAAGGGSKNGQSSSRSSNLASQRPGQRGGHVYNNALTLEVLPVPYIYPNIAKIDEYRKTKMIELPDGTTALSKTHAYIYRGGQRRRRFGVFTPIFELFLGKSHRLLHQQQKSSFTKRTPKLQHVLDTQADDFERTHADPPLVLVVGLDADRYPKGYLDKIIRDRLAYAQKHGYGIYIRYLQDFVAPEERDTQDKLSPLEFAKIALMREAMYAFRSSAWLWWLDQDAVIMNHDYDLAADILLNKKTLGALMQRDKPIIPPESIIHTYKRVPARQVRLLMMQNDSGINMASFIVRNDPLYGHLLMDYLADPSQRRYQGFRSAGSGRALNAAMTHLLQWHPALLSRMALVPTTVLGAYPEDSAILKGTSFQPGDFVYLLKSSLIANRGVLDVDFITDEWAVMKSSSVAGLVVPPPLPPGEAERRLMKGGKV